MRLNELFDDKRLVLFESTADHVIGLIRDSVPDCRAIYLHRESVRAPWKFTVVVSDQIDPAELASARQHVSKIENAFGGVKLIVDIEIESKHAENPEPGMKMWQHEPSPL